MVISCDDIIEKDISNKTIQINSPADGLQSEKSSITFWWEDDTDFDAYQIQIVEGRFDSVVNFIMDSNFVFNRFTYAFNPGSYQWRIRGFNGVSSTNFFTRSFKVDSTSNLAQTSVNIISPKGGTVFNTNKLTFRWDPVFSADNYIIEVVEYNWQTGNVFYRDTISNTSIVLEDTLQSIVYAWGIKAVNANSETQFSVENFEIDREAPSVPILNSPSNQTNVGLQGPLVNFRWTSGNDSNFSHDSIYIYSNPSLTLIESSAEVINGMHTDSLASGTYYWRVKSIDHLGNKSNFSTEWTFRVN